MALAGRRLMLISNSYAYGQDYLAHCAGALQAFLGPVRELAFVPFAAKDHDGYAAAARAGFARFGVRARGVHEGGDPLAAVREAPAVFVGGGNTFRLLKACHALGLIEAIRARADAGMPYLGASAGANLACPTIRTTNDMPIVEPPGFDALGLVPFQINPHFVDADPASKHMGETREKRIAEFHEENDVLVIGLREGAWITVERGLATLGGSTGARLFEKGAAPREWQDGPLALDRLASAGAGRA